MRRGKKSNRSEFGNVRPHLATRCRHRPIAKYDTIPDLEREALANPSFPTPSKSGFERWKHERWGIFGTLIVSVPALGL